MDDDFRLTYLFLYVRDMQAARSFYLETLGLDLLEEDASCVKFAAGQAILALNRAADYDIDLPERRDNSTDIVFLVDDIEAVRAGLEARGVRFLPTDHYQVGAIADFYDPDGHWLTLYEPSEEAMGWPSGERIAAVKSKRPTANVKIAGPTLAGAELIYIFLFVPDANAAEAFYHGLLGVEDLEGGPCSKATSGDEDGVIKYDTGGVMMTTHFFVDSGRNSDRAPEGEEPDEHACPPRELDASRMKGAAPAYHVADVAATVARLSREQPDFQPVITRSPVGVIATCDDPAGHRFFLYQPSREAMDSPSGKKLADILAADYEPVQA